MVWRGWSWIRSLRSPWRIGVFLGLLLLSVAPPVGLLWLGWPGLRDLLWIPLYIALLAWLWIWGHRVRGQLHPYGDYGLPPSQPVGLAIGIGCLWGLAGLLLFFWIEGALGWLVWQPISGSQIWLPLLSGLGLGLGVAWVEELLFRGWLWNELRDDHGPGWASGSSSLIFAIAHFLKPWQEILRTWPQFPGLMLMGWVLIRARHLTPGQLGSAIGLHAGWVWGITWVNTLDWVAYTDQVPEWITGIEGNPLAGVVGLVFLILNEGCIRLYARCRPILPDLDSTSSS